MRLDKFLKVSRLVKRRTVAKELCEVGGVSLNGRPAKAGSQVAVGDRLRLTLGARVVLVEVVALPEGPGRLRPEECYRYLDG